jgi:hypothetical protein
LCQKAGKNTHNSNYPLHHGAPSSTSMCKA